jgi:hypothetical protein
LFIPVMVLPTGAICMQCAGLLLERLAKAGAVTLEETAFMQAASNSVRRK